MKLRALAIVAVLLAVVAIGAWMWLGNDGAAPQIPDGPEAPAGSDMARTAPRSDAPSPSSPPARPTPGAGPEAAPQPAPPAAPVRMTSAVAPGQPMVRSAATPANSPVAASRAIGPGAVPEVEGRPELEKVQTMLRDFRTRMGENPVGSNAEIMRAVMGGNPVKARLGPPEGQGVNEQGELVDRWGTPYFFHQMSKTTMEVRSAGPDRVMWTADDLVTK